MRQHIRLGVLLVLLVAVTFAVYLDRRAAAVELSPVAVDTWQGSTSWSVADMDKTQSWGTIRLEMEADLLTRLDNESPKLVLETADGAQVPVLVWRVDQGQAVLQQFYNLRPAHYATLVVTWPGGVTDRIAIDVLLSKP